MAVIRVITELGKLSDEYPTVSISSIYAHSLQYDFDAF